MTTIETAISLGAVFLVAAGAILGLFTAGCYLSAVDLAGAAARAASVGSTLTPPRGTAIVVPQGEWVEVTATVGSPFGPMKAHVKYPRELHIWD